MGEAGKGAENWAHPFNLTDDAKQNKQSGLETIKQSPNPSTSGENEEKISRVLPSIKPKIYSFKRDRRYLFSLTQKLTLDIFLLLSSSTDCGSNERKSFFLCKWPSSGIKHLRLQYQHPELFFRWEIFSYEKPSNEKQIHDRALIEAIFEVYCCF